MADLRNENRELEMMQQLTTSLQSASTVEQVQQQVVAAIIQVLGFPYAMIGLVDTDEGVSRWLGYGKDGRLLSADMPAHQSRLPFTDAENPIVRALLLQEIQVTVEPPPFPPGPLQQYLPAAGCHIFPLMLRENAVGVLLVQTAGAADLAGRIPALQAMAGQAAVAVGTTMVCIDKARQLAVQDERLRIAQEMHDTVSQSLFGIALTLEGCLKLLPDQPETVIPELQRALASADTARREIRHSILDLWPTQLTAERFAADLQTYVHESCMRTDTSLIFDVRGNFGALTPGIRRSLYRIAQEAVANIAQHAGAAEAHVCVDVAAGRVRLSVRDDGKGFDTTAARNRPANRENFGLRGMEERARSLGGECHVYSKPGAGTSIIVDIPL